MFTNPEHLFAMHAERLDKAADYRRTRIIKAARRAERPSFGRRLAAALRRTAYATPQ